MYSEDTHQTFKVKGGGVFPTVLLYYDCCFPNSERDSAKIHQAGQRTIELARHVTSEMSNFPTAHLWERYHWKVIPDSIAPADPNI